MRIALWDLPPADLMASGFLSGTPADQFEVQRLRIPECERALKAGGVDVALLPTLSVLERPEDVDVVPAVALSTWKYPFARLVMDGGLGTAVGVVAYNPDFEQERRLCEIVLREHYRMEPEFLACEDAATEDLLRTDADARLLVGPDVPTLAAEGRMLDIGQEWFELAAYPMTWGLFAARKDDLDTTSIRAVRDAVLASEGRKDAWIREQEIPEALHAFYANELRFRLDDLCVAGLTEFRQYLFYHDVADDIRDIPFVFVPDEDDAADEGTGPIL